MPESVLEPDFDEQIAIVHADDNPPEARSAEAIRTTTSAARPDGKSLDQYPGHEHWTKRRWAWEFLTRNESFRRACDASEQLSEDEKLAIAATFGLRKFKHYKSKYGSSRPLFVTGQVRSWSNIVGEKYSADVPSNLPYGMVMVQFDLVPALTNERALEAQLLHAARRLRDRLKDLASSEGKRPLALKPKTLHFLNALRMADARASGMKRSDVARLLFPGVTRGRTDDEAAQHFKSHFRSAKELFDRGYLAVAASETEPPKRAKSSSRSEEGT